MPPSAQSTASKSTLNPNWPQYACSLTILVALLAATIRYLAIDWDDRFHCKALINSGQWMDNDLKVWQPEGCMTHQYVPKLISTCMPNRRIVFVGDSVTRELFYALATAADPTAPSAPSEDGLKHQDVHWSVAGGGPELQFFWDPYLNSTHLATILSNPYTLNSVMTHPNPPQPALLVLGSGLWYLRHPSSGGIASWEARIDQVFSQIARGSDPAGATVLADDIVFLPVPAVVPEKLSDERREVLLPSEIDAMNSDLLARLSPISSSLFFSTPKSAITRPSPPLVHLPLSFNDLLDESQTTDGLHYSPMILKVKAQLLLNLQCNDRLSKDFPMDKTCCRRYPGVQSVVQSVVLVMLVCWVSVGKLLEKRLAPYPAVARLFPKDDKNVLSLSVFGLCIGLTYLSDRTGIWLKENKHYDALTFGACCLATLVAGLATMKRSDGGKDLGFLNREQTDEWKGWMQIIILIYHYLGASKVSGIYNPVRVLVAAYLFMTGYGHFTYYYKKNEFGIDRIAMVMVRLNLLPLVLAYAMQTDYISYYFSPLVSFWYLIIFGTMYLGSSYNVSPYFLVPKLLIAACLTAWFMWTPWILESVFNFLAAVANIHWSAKEWAFRVNLDIWIVWLGMFTAYAYIKAKELGIPSLPWFPSAVKASVVLSTLAFGWFFWFEISQPSKFAYNAYHPVVSFVPVLAFVVLRNAHPFLRSVNSKLFMFFGQISLETFILQFHLWLGGDTKGVLLVIPGTKWRPLNVVITSIIFVFVSQKASQTTGQITNLLVGKSKKLTTLPAPATAGPSTTTSNGPSTEPAVKEQEAIPLLETNKPASTSDEPVEGGPSLTTSGRRPSAWPEWMRRTSFAVVVPPSTAGSSDASVGWVDTLKESTTLKLAAMTVGCWVLNLLSPWP